MTDLDTRVRQAFDNVTVPDDVKRGTLTYIASIAEASGVSAETAPASAAAPRKHARARIIPLRRAAAALAACLALAFAGFGGFAYAQPTTYVGIDVNPSIELGVNRFGIVVRAEALNGDGESLLDAVSLTGRGYADALSLLTQSDAFSPYAQEDSYVEISVTSDDARQAEAIRQQSDACLSALPCRGSCHAVDEGTREAAVSAGMGVGRYRAALELVELDPGVTLEECASLSMRELRDRIAALSSGDSEGRGSGNGQHGHGGSGGQHGKGNRSSTGMCGTRGGCHVVLPALLDLYLGFCQSEQKKFEILQNYPLPYVHLTGNIQNPRLRKARNGSLLKHQRDKQSPNGFKEF